MLITPGMDIPARTTPSIGIIANPRCHAHARHGAQIAAAMSRDPALLYEVPHTHAVLAATLAGFQRAGVALLIVNGGDGTLRDVLTALPAAYPEGPPDIALLPAGNTNLAAWSTGRVGRGDGALENLLAAVQSGTLRRATRPVLEIRWIGQPERPALRGLLFGAGGFAEAKRIADAHIHSRGLHRRHAVGLTLALTFLRTVLGGTLLRAGTHMSLGLDGMAPHAGSRFIVLATTLDRLTLGLWPFWGDGSGSIRWLDIDSPPLRLAPALIAILRHRPKPWMQVAGYRSGRATHITLSLPDSFVMDGEFFDTGPAGIELSAPDTVTFVRP